MKFPIPSPLILSALAFSLCVTGCITKRTVTEDGDFVSEKYILKTPFTKDPEF